MLREVSPFTIPPDLFQFAGFLQGTVFLPDEVEFGLDGGLLLDDLLDLAAASLVDHFYLRLESQ
jgi:hypothetical protein